MPLLGFLCHIQGFLIQKKLGLDSGTMMLVWIRRVDWYQYLSFILIICNFGDENGYTYSKRLQVNVLFSKTTGRGRRRLRVIQPLGRSNLARFGISSIDFLILYFIIIIVTTNHHGSVGKKVLELSIRTWVRSPGPSILFVLFSDKGSSALLIMTSTIQTQHPSFDPACHQI